jgi:hypothetical protein
MLKPQDRRAFGIAAQAGSCTAPRREPPYHGPASSSPAGAAAGHTPVYDRTLYILAGLLAIDLICNLLVKPVAEHHHMTDEELARERGLQHEAAATTSADASTALA